MITLRKHVFLCYTLRVVWCVLVVAEEWTVTIPNQISGLKGSCILIPCSFTHPSTYIPTNVTWYQYSKLPGKYPVVFSRTKPGDIIEHYSGRTELVGRASDGDCSLMINGMILEHNGEDIYPWVDEVSKSVFAFFQWRVTLEVTDTAPRPQLSVSEEQREGGNITVSCAVLHTCPSSPPSLSFGDQRGVVQGYHTEEIQGRWRVLSTISFVARAEDHEKVVACNVTHPGGQTAAGEVVLDVSYAPRSVSVSGGSTVVQVGTNLSLSCVSDANPPASSYLWHLLRDGLVMPLNHSTETAAVTDLHPDENAFHCTAINPLGRSKPSSSFVVTAEYKPSILANSSCSYHAGQVICRCQARARPRAKVLWMVDGGPLFPGSDPTTSPQNHTVMDIWAAEGTYENVSVTCLVNNTHGHDKLLLSVFVKGVMKMSSVVYEGLLL